MHMSRSHINIMRGESDCVCCCLIVWLEDFACFLHQSLSKSGCRRASHALLYTSYHNDNNNNTITCSSAVWWDHYFLQSIPIHMGICACMCVCVCTLSLFLLSPWMHSNAQIRIMVCAEYVRVSEPLCQYSMECSVLQSSISLCKRKVYFSTVARTLRIPSEFPSMQSIEEKSVWKWMRECVGAVLSSTKLRIYKCMHAHNPVITHKCIKCVAVWHRSSQINSTAATYWRGQLSSIP